MKRMKIIKGVFKHDVIILLPIVELSYEKAVNGLTLGIMFLRYQMFISICFNKSEKAKKNIENITERHVKDLGFKLTHVYAHNQYNTKRYTKGVLQVEFTYDAGNLITSDLTIGEVNCKPVTLEEITVLTPILGKWNE